MSIEIRPNEKTSRNYRIAYALSGLALFTVFGPTTFGIDSYINLPLLLESLSPIFVGMGAGLLLFKSIFNFNTPFILIDESEIRLKHSYWTQSFAWKRLKQLSLSNNRIELTYNRSGHTDSIKLPYLLRSNSTEIRDILKDMCLQHDVDFEVQIPFQPTSESYGFQNNH